jgi:hypothetical protein
MFLQGHSLNQQPKAHSISLKNSNRINVFTRTQP